MKRIFIVAMMIVVSLSLSGYAFASTTISDTAAMQSTNFGGGVYKPSTKVSIIICASTTGYVATSQHAAAATSSAGLQYATLSTSPAMPSKAAGTQGTCADPGTGAPQPPNGFASTDF